VEFSKKGREVAVLLAQSVKFSAGVTGLVRVAIGVFQDTKNVLVIRKGASPPRDIRQDLGVGCSREAACDICHTALGIRESVAVDEKFLAHLGCEAAEVGAIASKLVRVRESFRKSGGSGRLGVWRRSFS
jgi:hypothetical protein